MTEEIAGFQTSPKAQVQAAFEEIARRSMHDLSFLHPSMPVYVSDFTLFEGQWTGCVITPWMLSAVIFPGPDQLWPLRKVSEKNRSATAVWHYDLYRWRTGRCFSISLLFADVAAFAQHVD